MKPVVFVSPTESWIPRGTDRRGCGDYGASRKRVEGDRVRRYAHRGLDLYADPGRPIVSPTICEVNRHIRVYSDTAHYTGLELEAPWCRIKLLYVSFEPDAVPLGKELNAGEQIGLAQDIRGRYPGITPHVHLEFVSIDPQAVWEASGLVRRVENLCAFLRDPGAKQ